MTATDPDLEFMTRAVELASGGLGRVWPNPSVGCVIVKDGRIIGEARTADGGRPHAETLALALAGPAARGATAYVSLEPCAHHGKTPPCAQALVAAGVKRVVVAIQDPDPRVDGGGIAALRAAGVEISLGVGEEEARRVAEGFLSRVEKGRPFVTLKLATSADGRIATRTGESQWITGEESRGEVHRLRARHDAVMVGTNTALIDDPKLTVRLSKYDGPQPVRVVLDARLRLPMTANLVRTSREVPTWIVTLGSADSARIAGYVEAGCEIIPVQPDEDGQIDLSACLAALGRRGLTRLFVEGGARLAAGLVREGLVDRILWFRAPILLGGDGIPALAPFGVEALSDAPRFTCLSVEASGEDLLETYEPRH